MELPRALLLTGSVADAALAERELLGLPIGLRAALTLADFGAKGIEYVPADGRAELPRWLADPRARVPVGFFDGGAGPALALSATALVSPALLRELPQGRALASADGTRICVHLGAHGITDPGAALGSAPLHVFTPDAERYAISLASEAGRRDASRALFRSLVKPTDGPVSRHFNRHVSRAITRLALPLGMTPNQMTVVVAALGGLAAWFATFPQTSAQIVGAALYQLHSIVDGCDGEIARLTKRFGKHGALIDSLVDDLSNAAFFVGLSVGVSRALDARWPLYCAGLTAAAYFGVIALQYGVVLRATGRGDKTKFWNAPEAEKLSAFSIAKTLLRRDVFVLLIFFAVAFGFAPAAVAVFPFAALGALLASITRLRALKA